MPEQKATQPEAISPMPEAISPMPEAISPAQELRISGLEIEVMPLPRNGSLCSLFQGSGQLRKPQLFQIGVLLSRASLALGSAGRCLIGCQEGHALGGPTHEDQLLGAVAFDAFRGRASVSSSRQPKALLAPEQSPSPSTACRVDSHTFAVSS